MISLQLQRKNILGWASVKTRTFDGQPEDAEGEALRWMAELQETHMVSGPGPYRVEIITEVFSYVDAEHPLYDEIASDEHDKQRERAEEAQREFRYA